MVITDKLLNPNRLSASSYDFWRNFVMFIFCSLVGKVYGTIGYHHDEAKSEYDTLSIASPLEKILPGM